MFGVFLGLFMVVGGGYLIGAGLLGSIFGVPLLIYGIAAMTGGPS